jgi:hypothetical protein
MPDELRWPPSHQSCDFLDRQVTVAKENLRLLEAHGFDVLRKRATRLSREQMRYPGFGPTQRLGDLREPDPWLAGA